MAEAKRLRRCARNILHDPEAVSREWDRPRATDQVLAAAACLHTGEKVKITKAVARAMEPTNPKWKRRR